MEVKEKDMMRRPAPLPPPRAATLMRVFITDAAGFAEDASDVECVFYYCRTCYKAVRVWGHLLRTLAGPRLGTELVPFISREAQLQRDIDKNNSNVPIDVIIFTFYSDQLTIDVETGIVTK